MPLPAMLWSVISHHSIWYPANLLTAMVTQHAGEFTTAELEGYHADWFATAMILHGVLSVLFGLAFGLVLPRVPAIPGPMAWGEKGNPRRNIGPNATLFFQLEVLGITEAPKKAPLPPVEVKPDDVDQKQQEELKLKTDALNSKATGTSPRVN